MAEQQFWIGVHGVIEDRGKILVLRRAPSMIYKPGAWDLPGVISAPTKPLRKVLRAKSRRKPGSRSRSIGCFAPTRNPDPIYN